MSKHRAPESVEAFVLVRVAPADVSKLRTLIHDSKIPLSDMPFYSDARGWWFRSGTRDSELAKFDRLSTVFDTSMEYCKRLRDIVVG